jgi:hypothetical protein
VGLWDVLDDVLFLPLLSGAGSVKISASSTFRYQYLHVI